MFVDSKRAYWSATHTLCLFASGMLLVACGGASDEVHDTISVSTSTDRGQLSSDSSVNTSGFSNDFARPTTDTDNEMLIRDYLESLPTASEAPNPDTSERASMWASFFARVGETLKVAAEDTATTAESARETAAALAIARDELAKSERELDAKQKIEQEALDELTRKGPPYKGVQWIIRSKRLTDASADVRAAKTALVLDSQIVVRSAMAHRAAVATATDARARLERLNAAIAPPDIAPILSRELKIGNRRVLVRNHRDSDRIIGEAKCDENGAPEIVMASNSRTYLMAEALLFFREHEFAHLVLGHVVCEPDRQSPTPQRVHEIQADCLAAQNLKRFADGARVVDVAVVHFRHWREGARGNHPASDARAHALWNDCTD